MSPSDYWHGDPELMGAYRKAYKIEKEEKNWELWLQGYYFYIALSVIVQNALGASKGKPVEYPDKPLDIFPPTEEEKKQAEEEALNALVNRLNRITEVIKNDQRNHNKPNSERHGNG